MNAVLGSDLNAQLQRLAEEIHRTVKHERCQH